MLGKWLALVLGLLAAAPVTESAIHVDCPELGREAAAQVEARARATLLTNELGAAADIQCEAGTTTIRVRGEGAEISRAVSVSGTAWNDNVIAALTDALAELGERQPPAAAATLAPSTTVTTAPPRASAAPFAAPTAPASAAPRQPTHVDQPAAGASARPELLLAESTTKALRVGLLSSIETWQPAPAYGVALLLDRRAGAIYYGLAFGVASDFKGHSRVSAYEGQIAAELGYRLSGLGLDLLGFAGASWLQLSPARELAQSTDQRSAVQPFLELRLALPLRCGPLEIVPGVGGRLFSGTRTVNVDDRRELTLNWALARFTLGFVYELAAAN